MGKRAILAIALAVFIAIFLWLLSAPRALAPSATFDRVGNVENGQTVFYAGGCAACHSAPKAIGDEKLVLSGGRAFASPFGTFFAPNISSNPEFGIGEWSNQDLANAMKRGVSPDGKHYYPAFPYTSYARVTINDIVDLRAFLNTLPDSTATNRNHKLPLPFRLRRGVGLWKILFLSDGPVITVPDDLARGQYLVEGLGHCTECHSPRNVIGGIDPAKWLAGAPVPDGKGRVPNITPHADGLGHWSLGDITEYLDSGFTPDFDSASGAMVDVVENTEHLSDADRLAIAKYLKAVPEVASR